MNSAETALAVVLSVLGIVVVLGLMGRSRRRRSRRNSDVGSQRRAGSSCDADDESSLDLRPTSYVAMKASEKSLGREVAQKAVKSEWSKRRKRKTRPSKRSQRGAKHSSSSSDSDDGGAVANRRKSMQSRKQSRNTGRMTSLKARRSPVRQQTRYPEPKAFARGERVELAERDSISSLTPTVSSRSERTSPSLSSSDDHWISDEERGVLAKVKALHEAAAVRDWLASGFRSPRSSSESPALSEFPLTLPACSHFPSSATSASADLNTPSGSPPERCSPSGSMPSTQGPVHSPDCTIRIMQDYAKDSGTSEAPTKPEVPSKSLDLLFLVTPKSVEKDYAAGTSGIVGKSLPPNRQKRTTVERRISDSHPRCEPSAGSMFRSTNQQGKAARTDSSDENEEPRVILRVIDEVDRH